MGWYGLDIYIYIYIYIYMYQLSGLEWLNVQTDCCKAISGGMKDGRSQQRTIHTDMISRDLLSLTQ
jgi:hypothetical protein